MCVFTWGLQYKLSLYYPPHSSFHQVPEAKLLSKNEQPRIALDLPSERLKKTANNIQQLSLTALMLAWLTSLTLGLALAAERRFLPRVTSPGCSPRRQAWTRSSSAPSYLRLTHLDRTPAPDAMHPLTALCAPLLLQPR